MIAANHPALGMNPHASGDSSSPIFGPAPRYFPPAPAPPPIVHAQPAPVQAPPVNQISPPPVIVHVSPVLETLPESPAVPASAAAGTQSVPASTDTGTSSIDSFLTWLTEQTIYSGIPNGAIFAGGVIGALWLFGGKKGRR